MSEDRPPSGVQGVKVVFYGAIELEVEVYGINREIVQDVALDEELALNANRQGGVCWTWGVESVGWKTDKHGKRRPLRALRLSEREAEA